MSFSVFDEMADENMVVPFAILVRMRKIPGVKCKFKFGHNDSVGTSMTSVCTYGDHTYMPTASTLFISSDDAADTSEGTGARTVAIQGLDDNWNEVTETVTLNGLTGVETSTTFNRVNRMQVLTGGSGGANAGKIYAGTGTITGGVPANVYAEIVAGNNKTLLATYTIPAGYTGFLYQYHLTCGKGDDTEFRVVKRTPGGVFTVESEQHLYQSSQEFNRHPLILPEKTDVEVRAKSAVGTVSVSATFALFLFEGDWDIP